MGSRRKERLLTDLLDYDLAFKKYNHKELGELLGVSYRNIEESSNEYYKRKRVKGKLTQLLSGELVYNNEEQLNYKGAWNELKHSGMYQELSYGKKTGVETK